MLNFTHFARVFIIIPIFNCRFRVEGTVTDLPVLCSYLLKDEKMLKNALGVLIQLVGKMCSVRSLSLPMCRDVS